MRAHTSPWYAHALQRTATGPAEPLTVPSRMEWATLPGLGPGAEILGSRLRQRRVLELGCGPGHNVAYLAASQGARVTGIDLVGLQVRRARSHYGRLAGATFVTGHALRYLRASEEWFDAIYSVFGAVGLVAPELLLPAIAAHLRPGRVLAFSVPHPRRAGGHPATDDLPRRDHVTLPDRARLPIARWEFDSDRWTTHLARAGLAVTSVQELRDPRRPRFPTTLLIAARKC
ncbi:class I SAM-dependent methyltransferase [Streptomyces palmae]|uniref:Class I SAM-dependent methyltransferase n=1 Tax=Streptomyces palmae TaxID=1701085 RepID=A0A4Z0GYN9_9ACTN|nr:class I SAM-dependent methyltransferase [Streptomyces palmae]TGB01783.1 class I SAM-dependent methyltransferase [Streptomyces palmae]